MILLMLIQNYKSIFHKKKKTFMSNSVMCFCDEDVSIGESVKKLSKILTS